MPIAPQYHPSDSNLVHETIDGETVIVNLSSGSYYSLVGVGSIVWTELDAGRSVEHILDRLYREYEGNPHEIETAVRELLQELVTEKLLVPDSPADAPLPIVPPPVPPAQPHATKAKFQTPRLTKFSDMQELLLLDPVHEVVESGWPHRDSGARA